MGVAAQVSDTGTRRPVGRGGIKPCSLLGEKLGSLFEVPTSSSAAIDALLQQLERKLS